MVIAALMLQMSIGLTFFACELGQRITNAFDNVDEALNELDWYLFPIGVKKMLAMIMGNTQEIVALKCFGSMVCGRDVFKNVSVMKIFSVFI